MLCENIGVRVLGFLQWKIAKTTRTSEASRTHKGFQSGVMVPPSDAPIVVVSNFILPPRLGSCF